MDAALNWVWQGCLVALALSIMLRLLERARANVRYVVCWAALLLILVLLAYPTLGTDATRPDVAALVTAEPIVSVPDTWWTSSAVTMAAWLAWVAVYTVRVVRAMVALHRARASSRPFPAHVESALRHWRRVRSNGRHPGLVLSDSVPTAAVLGCGSPLVAVAPALLTTLDTDELDRVLIHEWAHVQRRDDLVNILQIVIRIVVGWHPAVWWIDRRLQLEREIACDEMTVAITCSPKPYAESLVKLATVRGAEPTALAGPAVLTGASLRVRVTRIVSRHAFIEPWWSRGIAVGIVSALCAVAGAVGGLRLVEVTAFALPFESVRMVNVSFPGVVPIAAPTPASRQVAPPVRRPRQSPASARSTRHVAAQDHGTGAAIPDQKAQVARDVPRPVESMAPPQPTVETRVDTETVPEPPAVAPPTPSRDVVVEAVRPPWMEAADAGTALGRKSKDAGLATAGFFTRFARRVAGF